MLSQINHYLNRPAGKTVRIAGDSVSRGRLLGSCLVLLVMSGCSSYGVIHNQPATNTRHRKTLFGEDLGAVRGSR